MSECATPVTTQVTSELLFHCPYFVSSLWTHGEESESERHIHTYTSWTWKGQGHTLTTRTRTVVLEVPLWQWPNYYWVAIGPQPLVTGSTSESSFSLLFSTFPLLSVCCLLSLFLFLWDEPRLNNASMQKVDWNDDYNHLNQLNRSQVGER